MLRYSGPTNPSAPIGPVENSSLRPAKSIHPDVGISPYHPGDQQRDQLPSALAAHVQWNTRDKTSGGFQLLVSKCWTQFVR